MVRILCVSLDTEPIKKIPRTPGMHKRPPPTDVAWWPTIKSIWTYVLDPTAMVNFAPASVSVADLCDQITAVDAVYAYNAFRWTIPCLRANNQFTDFTSIKWKCAMQTSRANLYYSDDAKFASLDRAYADIASFGIKQLIPHSLEGGALACWKLCAVVEQIHPS